MHRRVDGVKQGSREGPRPTMRLCAAPLPRARLATGGARDLRVFGPARECKEAAGLDAD